MKINKQIVDNIAELAKLEFDDKEKKEILADMNNILTFVEKLNELDTSKVKPLIYINDNINILREDITCQDITKNEVLQNAALKDSDYIKVAKVIKKPTNK